jgi:hypothetical protein
MAVNETVTAMTPQTLDNLVLAERKIADSSAAKRMLDPKLAAHETREPRSVM